MARIRTFKPEFLRHEELQKLEKKNKGKYPMFVFMGLWSVCDKQGVFPWKPSSLKLDIYPFLNFNMEDTLNILFESGFIFKFEADNNTYGYVINFEKHQRITGIEGKNPAKYPEPDKEALETHLRHARDTLETHSIDREKEREKEREREMNSFGSKEPTDNNPNSVSKTKKPPLREREPENDMERVEKVYLHNWDILYAKKLVETPEPINNWGQSRKLLKQHFEKKIPPDLIIKALNNAKNDKWVSEKGYSLTMMLSSGVLNNLINGRQNASQSPPKRISKDEIPPDQVKKYFKE